MCAHSTAMSFLSSPNTDATVLGLTTTALAVRAFAPSTDYVTGPAVAAGLAGGCYLLASAWRHAVDSRTTDETTARETSVKAARGEILDALIEAGLSQRDAASTFDAIKARLAIVAAS